MRRWRVPDLDLPGFDLAAFVEATLAEDLGGVARGWHNVQIEGVPLGNPYAQSQDERWAHPNHRELPLMDGSKIGMKITSYDAEGKITQETAILPPTFTDDKDQENP